MRHGAILVAVMSTLALGRATLFGTPGQAPTTIPPSVSFATDIRPLFETRCVGCHGETLKLSDLSLATREALLEGGKGGAAIVPGSAEASRLYRLAAGLDAPRMPATGAPLSAGELEALKAWIDQGASWDESAAAPLVARAAPAPAKPLPSTEETELPPGARDYWAFTLPIQAPLPAVPVRFTNPIDRFLEDARRARELAAAPRADRATLLRRAYLDLIGLPPTSAQREAFMADTAPGAWERVIESLLASPHYGERWGRHWLDVARYADSNGFENDLDRPNFWRYRDYVIRSFNDDKPYDQFIREQVAGDELEHRTDDQLIATGFLRAGPRVANREKDNPERRHDYLDDVIGTIGRGVLGMTVSCARCHDHKFDPILQRDYYAMQASLFGYVEVTYPLGPREKAEEYLRAVAAIDAQIQPLVQQIRAIETPYRQALALIEIKQTFPANVQAAVGKPEGERTPGERLLAKQVLESAVNVRPQAIDDALSPEDAARKKALTVRIADLNRTKPQPGLMAEIATDGDWRSTPDRRGDDIVGCPECRIPDPAAGPFLQLGPGAGRYRTPPSHFLIRGDPRAKGKPTAPGFLTVATYGNPPRELPPADGRTGGRRRALAEWLISRSNPLTARVMVNRIWHHHFGRGIVGTLDNLGKMGDAPTHPELLDWLAVEFMNRGWSVKAMHRLIMTSEAYQMASEHTDAAAAAKDPDDAFLWRYRIWRLEGEIVRDSIMAVAGSLDRTIGGPPVFPFMPASLLASMQAGIWRNEADGPKVWRRSVYVYAKRGLPYPMLHAFDLPDQNISFGARHVSTLPTQALILMNDEFVLRQAQLLADRLKREAGADVNRQITLAYQLAMSRQPTAPELATASRLVAAGSLTDFTSVLMNLTEFLYTR